MNTDALRIEVASVEARHLTAVKTVPGVIPLLAAARNGPGIGQLLSGDDEDGSLLSWRAPGSNAFGEAVQCSPDGVYVLCDGEAPDKWIRIEVHGDYLAVGSQAEVFLADVYNNAVAGDDVTADEAETGDVAVYTLALRNTSAAEITGVAAWVDPAAAAAIEISLDGATWSRPESEETALTLPPIPAESSATLYMRRTIAVGEASSPKSLVHLHFSFAIL